jgi:hypothetical protein
MFKLKEYQFGYVGLKQQDKIGSHFVTYWLRDWQVIIW